VNDFHIEVKESVNTSQVYGGNFHTGIFWVIAIWTNGRANAFKTFDKLPFQGAGFVVLCDPGR